MSQCPQLAPRTGAVLRKKPPTLRVPLLWPSVRRSADETFPELELVLIPGEALLGWLVVGDRNLPCPRIVDGYSYPGPSSSRRNRFSRPEPPCICPGRLHGKCEY